MKALTTRQKEVLLSYVQGAQRAGRHLSRSDLKDLGYSRDTVRAQFGNYDSLRALAKKHFPEEFAKIREELLQRNWKSGSTASAIKKGKRFVITTAVDDSPVHRPFFEALKRYCKHNDATLLILPVQASQSSVDEALVGEHWIFEDVHLNSNFSICSIKINPKTAQPTTGLKRIGQRDGSIVVASPKQFLEFVAVGNEKTPHAVMSTGAVTSPNYRSRSGDTKRIDYIANHDHVLGAVIVEIENKKRYHFRQVQADPSGRFYDLGVEYSASSVRTCAPSGMLWGDLHSGEIDATAKKAAIEMIRHTKVERVFWGDAFSGISVNHHEEDNLLVRAVLAEKGKLNLEQELRELAKEIDEITSMQEVKSLEMVWSNHHEFLTKHYLPKGKYKQDPQNYRIAHKLALAMMDGKDPIQFACEDLIGLKHPKKVRWLKRDEDVRIGGVQMGAHGDRGANGAKGSKATIENAYGRCMHGHTHSPYIFRGIFCVGTTSVLRAGYNEGPSGWVHTHGFVYPNGMMQLINVFDGRWRSSNE